MNDDGEPDDEVLLDRARDGDGEAFRILFERHAGALRARADRQLPGRLTRKLSLADLVQETRIAASARLAHYDPARGTLRAWLVGILDNRIRKVIRHYAGTGKRAAFREVSRMDRVDTGNFVDRGPSPSEMAVASELRERIRRAREALPEGHREALRLVHEEGLSLREVAERLDRSRDAAKKLYARAFRRFKQAFDAADGASHE